MDKASKEKILSRLLAVLLVAASMVVAVSCGDSVEGEYDYYRIVKENVFEDPALTVIFDDGKVMFSDGRPTAEYTVKGRTITIDVIVDGRSETVVLVKKDNYWLGDGFLLCRSGERPKDFRDVRSVDLSDAETDVENKSIS